MSSEPQKWIELAVEAEPEAVEAITELFARYGYNQGVVIEEPVQPGPDGGAVVDSAAPVKIRTYLPLEVETEPKEEEDISPEARGLNQAERIQKLREGLYYLGMLRRVGALEVNERREEDWANAWKAFYQVHRVGRRTVIKPPWQPYEAASDDLVIEIDPGMAFGTGLHPTTRLCLTLLEDYLNPIQYPKVLDLGTGSGILAIAAAKLLEERGERNSPSGAGEERGTPLREQARREELPFGSRRGERSNSAGAGQEGEEPEIVEVAPVVVGVDTDPVAVRAALENVERNGLKDKVVVEVGSLAVEPGSKAEGGFYSFSESAQKPPQALTEALPFDAVIANIIARIIVALAVPLAQALKPGGLLITSGIIEERADEVTAALTAAGFKLVERRQEGDWVAFAHRKDAI